jgi:amidase/aspartyl-tRNA(Asn)/glutamyl-tRNA(Gln) amidotransferase subunit A
VPNAFDGTTLGPASIDGHCVERTIGWCLTHPVNLTGHPAISVPAGLTASGLPVGLQVISRRFRDEDVITIARGVEQRRPWSAMLDSAVGRIQIAASVAASNLALSV